MSTDGEKTICRDLEDVGAKIMELERKVELLARNVSTLRFILVAVAIIDIAVNARASMASLF